jgi:uncharacterized protein (DUF433 family)
MERTFVPTNSFEQKGSVPIDDAASSQIWSIIFSGTVSIERQNISRVQNTLQVTVPEGVAATRIRVHPQITEESIVREFEGVSVVTTEHPYIVRDLRIGQGEPIIIGTAVRVRVLVEYWRAGTPPEELLQAFPHLTLAQVFDALSYYQDHQSEINALIEHNRVDLALLHESVRQRS